ncbi:glycosyltransferase family 2 protein [Arthrobacter sp. M4]|uniref:glycosyltransferase family 2 protein n=1 Tax=Arthrobacter sp. M4 TaxID=218160 RepID=UPI001CDB8277|nr:glycosyltransferase family 2 protein [Arthrobacter sp. M4]MCA4132249.1 glycosyltransferase family 2 protein [Arthrobacter sp. M4]
MNTRNDHSSRPVRASICMATYKGERYVREQLESILAQLGSDDEVVIVDDASPDGTVDQIEAIDDPRIRLIRAQSNQGYVKSFQQAVQASRGERIFLSDQDDVWTEGRLDRMLQALASSAVVASNFAVLDGGPRPSIPLLRPKDGPKRLANLFGILIGYRAYYGCGMAFRRDVADVFVPVPRYLRESHDLWLAILGNLAGSMAHLEEPTLLRRIHEENATPRGWRSLPTILRARVVLGLLMIEGWRRLRGRNLQQA